MDGRGRVPRLELDDDALAVVLRRASFDGDRRRCVARRYRESCGETGYARRPAGRSSSAYAATSTELRRNRLRRPTEDTSPAEATSGVRRIFKLAALASNGPCRDLQEGVMHTRTRTTSGVRVGAPRRRRAGCYDGRVDVGYAAGNWRGKRACGSERRSGDEKGTEAQRSSGSMSGSRKGCRPLSHKRVAPLHHHLPPLPTIYRLYSSHLVSVDATPASSARPLPAPCRSAAGA
ncbi:hypothetical protein EWM64_g9587 [Hericium alpestre]|uniref:Uncharacterized protein n=1 Tax=Hericium alpestre TaxID=135208 RepID=A0A4Y9ZI81_9AGAM|nr:hypothetical protein EWM64_g9587 [Hericium alpestre]